MNLRAFPHKISYPSHLPIIGRKHDIIKAVLNHQVVIITGETGSGKTTQIPKMCLEAGRGITGMIGCTQPRRVAAISVAGRIAEEMGQSLGLNIGYKIRFDDKTGPRTVIKIMTDGILLMETQTDPDLSRYDTIIIDEAHERSLNIDFTLGIMKTLLGKRKDLKLIITSATIDSEKFSRAFAGAAVIEVSGRTYPVDVLYRPKEQNGELTYELSDPEAAVAAVMKLRQEYRYGDILIFMATERDIRETCELLKGQLGRESIILPLFARLPWSEQRRIFQSPGSQKIGTQKIGAQKIIVATNIAETSLTIPGIQYVIDPGTARIAHYNPRTGTNSLPVREISRSSADQRKGRCGRVAKGLCIRLYSEDEYNDRPLYTTPEIMRANLAGVILQMLSLNLHDIFSFPFIDSPSNRGIQDGLETLRELQAIKRNTGEANTLELTSIGRLMAKIPLDPRLARMIIEAKKGGCLEEMTVIAAALSLPDPRERPAEKAEAADKAQAAFMDISSDFLTLLNIWKGFQALHAGKSSRTRIKKYCRDHFLSYRRMCEWQDVHEQIRRILGEQKFNLRLQPPISDYQTFYAALHKSILSGYLSNIALKKEKNLYAATKGREVMLFPGSGLFNRGGRWIVAAEMVETSRIYARGCANIESEWLEALAGDLCRSTYSEPRWEKNRGEVVASEQVSLFGLIIVPQRTVSYGPISPAEAGNIFIRQALLEGEVKYPFPFLKYNQALVEKIASLEDRLRRNEFLLGDEELAMFYEARLPGIYNIRTLQKLIRDRGSDVFLRMQESDVLAHIPEQEELALYPEELKYEDRNFPLVYRFAPETIDDGVTARIPLHLLPEMTTRKAEWLIPGLLREKIAFLLKGLPKEYRKRLLPLKAACDIIVKEMEDREGSFLASLADFVYRRFGVEIPAAAWPVEGLPEYLRLRFSVINENNEELAAGRDIALLKSQTIGQITSEALAAGRERWEKSDIRDWDFGDLPEYIDLSGGHPAAGRAYPALVAAEGKVSLRLLENRDEAAMLHREGVIALYALFFAEECRNLKKNIALNEEMKVWAKHLGGAGAIEAAIIKRVMKNLFTVDIRTSLSFRSHATMTAAKILPEGQEVRKTVLPVLKSSHEAMETLRSVESHNRANRPALLFLDHLKENLLRLARPDFIENYRLETLPHLPRYLRALTISAQRGMLNLEKAMTKAKEIQLLVDELQDIIETIPPFSSEEKKKDIDEYFWMIEEYRVSLFAQELKTPYPVSRKKLDDKVREIKRIY